MTDADLVSHLRALCDPSAEAMSDGQRLTEFVQVGTEAAARIEAFAVLETSWRETLRKERDARLHEVRMKERYRAEIAQLEAERKTQ
jgi:hypothetical protein